MSANTVTISGDPKVLTIFGSPHDDGFTARLLRRFEESAGLKTDLWFSAYRENPLPCTDCGYCKTHSGCSRPDLHEFYRQLEGCNELIFAFPVYNGSFPAPMKALIDRMQVYFNARFSRGIRPPIATPKAVSVLMTAGGKRDYSDLILEQLKPLLTVINGHVRCVLCLAGTDKGCTDAEMQRLIDRVLA